MRPVTAALWVVVLAGTARAGQGRLVWYSMLEADSARQAEKHLLEVFAARGLAFLSREELSETLRRADDAAGVLERAAAALEEGRRFHLGMELERAVAAYSRSRDELLGGLVQYYEPRLLAEPLLQLGVAQFEAGRREEAAAAFREAWLLVPGLQLGGGYFSPRVREFFGKVTAGLRPAPAAMPAPREASRLCQATAAPGLVILQQERVGEDWLLRAGLFDCTEAKYLQLESTVSDGDQAATVLAERLFPALAGLAGLTPAATAPEAGDGGQEIDSQQGPDAAPTADGNGGVPDGGLAGNWLGGPPDGGPETPLEAPAPPPAWYLRHWWIWPLAAAVIGGAVALPLTVWRRDVVDIHVR